MRDHTKLNAYQMAEDLAVAVYLATRAFPKEETYGLSFQMRKSAVSVGSNIVEGSARRSEADYLRFLDIAYASSRELQFQIHLATRLGYLPSEDLRQSSESLSRSLNALLRSLKQTPPK